MKKLLITGVAIIMVLSFTGCDKNGNGPDVHLESSWSKEVRAHPFLKNFPEYKYDFQGAYMNVPGGGETYVLTDRKGSETKLNEYRTKLSDAGFTEEKLIDNSYSCKKTIDDGELTANPSLSSNQVIVSYSLIKK